jgi:hypothetical protein
LRTTLRSSMASIESRWMSNALAFARQLRARRRHDRQPFWTHLRSSIATVSAATPPGTGDSLQPHHRLRFTLHFHLCIIMYHHEKNRRRNRLRSAYEMSRAPVLVKKYGCGRKEWDCSSSEPR